MTVPVPNVLCRTVSPGANTSAAFAASGRRCSTLGAGTAERWRCEVPLPNVDGFLPASGLMLVWRTAPAGRTRVRAEDAPAVHVGPHAGTEGATQVAALLPAGALEPGLAHAGELDIRRENLAHKAAARIGLRGTVGAARGGVREEQALASARDGHVGQAALLLKLCGVVGEAGHVREVPASNRPRRPRGTPSPLPESARSSW